MEEKKLVRWPYLVLGMCLFLFTGVVYAWSLFAGSLELEYGWTRAETSFVYTLCMVFFNVANLFGGFICNKTSIKVNLLITTVLLLVGFLGAANATEIWHLYVFYGGFVGLAIGTAYSAMISTIVSWYPDKPGTASGMLLLAFGMSTMIVGTQVARLFGVIGFKSTFTVMGIAAAAITVVVAIFMKKPPADAVFPQPKDTGKKPVNEPVEDMSSKQVLRRPSFWLFMLWQFGVVSAGMAVIGQAATAADSIGASVALATVATSGLSVANGVSRFLWGALCDLLGIKKVRLLLNISMLAALVVCLAALYTSNVILLIVGFILIGAAYGGTVAYPASYIRFMYGNKYYPTNFSLYFCTGFIMALIGPTVMASVYMASGYFAAFAAMLGFAVVGIVASLFIKKP